MRDRVWAWVREDRRRRGTYAVLALLLAILCFVPRPYVARAKLAPQDAMGQMLSSLLNSGGGQLQSFAALLGGRPPTDLYLIIGKSQPVTDDVIKQLRLVGPSAPYSNARSATLALQKRVDVHQLLGGVIEVETKTHDPDRSAQWTGAYADAIGRAIAQLGREGTSRKKAIVESRFKDASLRVAQTEGALNAFRRANKLAEPEAELGSALILRTNLQAQLQSKQVEVQTLEQVRGPDNPMLAAAQSELASLRAQVAATASAGEGPGGPNFTGLSELSTQYLNLYRDYRFAQALYEVYARAVEQVEVEELASDSASYVQVIEPAHVDAARSYNTPAVALLALLVLLAFVTEFYGPATGLIRWRPADDVAP